MGKLDELRGIGFHVSTVRLRGRDQHSLIRARGHARVMSPESFTKATGLRVGRLCVIPAGVGELGAQLDKAVADFDQASPEAPVNLPGWEKISPSWFRLVVQGSVREGFVENPPEWA